MMSPSRRPTDPEIGFTIREILHRSDGPVPRDELIRSAEIETGAKEARVKERVRVLRRVGTVDIDVDSTEVRIDVGDAV